MTDTQVLFSILFNSPEGKRALLEIERRAGVGSDPFDPQSERQTCHRLGRLSLAREIRKLAEAKE